MVLTMETREEGEDDSVTPSLSPSSRVRDDEGKVTGSVKSVEDVTSAELYGRGELSKAVVSVEDEWKTTQKAVQRPRTYRGFQYPTRVDCQWTAAGPPSAPYFHPVRRTAYTSYPPARHPILHCASHRQGKSTSTMDYVPSPESFYAPDFVKSTFAASPNSLYMYDQERHDMQNTLSNGMFGQTCPGTGIVPLTAEPEFDLNPQFENSNSLEGFFGGALTRSLMPSPCEGSIGGSTSGRSEKPDSTGLLGLLEVSQQELKLGGPTLAELNMDPFLMEDIDNLIENEEEEKKPDVGTVKQMGCSDVMKQLTAGQSGQMEAAPKTLTTLNSFNPTTTTTSLSNQPRAELTQLHTQPLSRPAAPLSSPYGGNRTLNVAVVPPISVSATTTIKTEPIDTYESGDKPCLHKMLSSSPPAATQRAASVSPPQCGSASPGRRVMPVVGQARAPPLGQQVKAESVEEKWKEIEKFIHDPETSSSSSSRKRKRHESGGSAIMSDEEDSVRLNFSDEDDSDSDGDSDMSDSPLDESLTELAKKSKQYFWQYNVQAKGPKGTRLKLNIGDTDPHHPSNFEDPVFDASSTSLVGIRHGGKARKGDGNEVTPNPRKLFQIGKQLYKLNRQINGFQVSNDLPASVRNKSRKEKNKLASRACRLKKKAQHEANKVKLTGLGCEQSELLEVIHLIWPLLKERAQQHMKGLVPSPGYTETLSDRLDAIIQSQRKTLIAGNTTDYVNEVIAKVEEGDPTGGLPIKPRVKK